MDAHGRLNIRILRRPLPLRTRASHSVCRGLREEQRLTAPPLGQPHLRPRGGAAVRVEDHAGEVEGGVIGKERTGEKGNQQEDD